MLYTKIQQEWENLSNIFWRKVDFENIKFPVKFRDINEIGKTNCISVSERAGWGGGGQKGSWVLTRQHSGKKIAKSEVSYICNTNK